MTRQISDVVYYKNQMHIPLSISGKGLPHPRDFGLRPFAMSTACWRGFYCEYTIHEARLLLTHLVVRNNGDYPTIDGVDAIEDRRLGNGVYAHLNVPAPLTGGILLGIDDVDVPHIHFDLDHLIGSVTILELLFENGFIVEIKDHSASVAAKRDDLVKKQRLELPNWIVWSDPRLVGTESAEYDLFAADIKAWIRSTLTLDYKFGNIAWLNKIYP